MQHSGNTIEQKPRRWWALLAVIALIVAGCGSGEEDTAPQPTQAAEPDDGNDGTEPAGESAEYPPDADPELIEVYESVVQEEMPGVPFEILQGAAEEGTVSVYSLRIPDAMDPLLEAFQERFPFVSVENYQDSGPPLYERFVSEQRANRQEADVMQTADTVLMESIVDEGFAAQYTVSSEDEIDLSAVGDTEGYWYPFAMSTRVVLMYNTDLVDDERAELLDSWEGLWSGEFSGSNLMLLDATAASSGQQFFFFLKEEYGDESWEALAALDPTVQGATPISDAIARGAGEVGTMSESIAAQQYEAGAPVAWKVPNPVLALPWPQAVVENAPHPNAARLFQEFTMSHVGQTIYQNSGLLSFREGVDVEPDFADEPWFSSYTEREPWPFPSDVYTEELEGLLEEFTETFK